MCIYISGTAFNAMTAYITVSANGCVILLRMKGSVRRSESGQKIQSPSDVSSDLLNCKH